MSVSGVRLASLLDMENSHEVFGEVKNIVLLMCPEFNIEPLENVFSDVLQLFAGNYPGYRACNIQFHNLQHTTGAFLSLSRLIHGAIVENLSFSERGILLALISALLHDAGYMQTKDDKSGTGAKYTLIHVERSIDFMNTYLGARGYSDRDINCCKAFLQCTGLDIQISDIDFGNTENELLGKMMGTADLLSQMSDRTYCEKLLFLYREFVEGGIRDYSSEFDLLQKTPEFLRMVKKRFVDTLSNVYLYSRPHFKARWGIDMDLYLVSVNRNVNYLHDVIHNHPVDYRNYMRRGGLVRKYEEKMSSFGL